MLKELVYQSVLFLPVSGFSVTLGWSLAGGALVGGAFAGGALEGGALALSPPTSSSSTSWITLVTVALAIFAYLAIIGAIIKRTIAIRMQQQMMIMIFFCWEQ
jgi:hypothetical protein